MEMKKWYKVDTKTKIKDFYSQYTIKDFWNWWSTNEPKVMEVRIRDYSLIKQVANKYGFPYSSSGVYVKSAQELKTVIAAVRDKATIWMGVSERKKNYSSNNKWKTYSGGQRGGSSDDNIKFIDFIFIDIDRKIKDAPASNKELENCDILAEKILEKMAINKWNKSYAKICSGNGIQLLFKLDIPILLPTRTYNNEKKYFETSEEFDRLKILVKDAFGTPLRRFTRRFEDELGVEIDKSAFNINRVCALCATKNYKYDGFTWRGVIHIEDGKNEGLSDYLLSKINDVKTYKTQSIFVKTRTASHKNIIKKGKLREHPIVKLLMENDLPGGELNNKVWFQLKAILRDSSFDMNSVEFRDFHKELEAKYRGRFTLNLPTKQFDFNEDVINSFCFNNCIPPLYKLWSNRTKKLNMKLEEMRWGVQKLTPEVMKLDTITTIQQDLKNVSNKLTSGDYKNILTIAAFINGCLVKYGEKKTKYFLEHLFDRYLNYS